MKSPREIVQAVLGRFGYAVVNLAGTRSDVESDFYPLYEACREYTMTSLERLYALHRAVLYVSDHEIPGAIVECGVWRGGSSMLAARSLLDQGDTSRDLVLYDTFDGMTRPDAVDVSSLGKVALERWKSAARSTGGSDWAAASLEEVRANMLSTDYPSEKLVFVKGPVEETIPEAVPNEIAILRLDTDWYASTRHELEHLFPRLSPGGVLIVDDYGCWDGARKAVDEYLGSIDLPIYLNRIDSSARVALKPR